MRTRKRVIRLTRDRQAAVYGEAGEISVARSLVRLCDLRPGTGATIERAELDAETRFRLQMLGIRAADRVRVCQNRGACVIQVRSTRLGLARSVAARIYVIADPPES